VNLDARQVLRPINGVSPHSFPSCKEPFRILDSGSFKVGSLSNLLVYKLNAKGMKNKEIIGIDVSKKVLDVYILKVKHHFTVLNSATGFRLLLETVASQLHGDPADVVYCFEETGRYSRMLSVFLSESGLPFILLNALDVKRSMGLTRGKSDKKDARMIAQYAWRKRDELTMTNLAGPVMDQLRQLVSLREMIIKHRTAVKNTSKDLHDGYSEGEFAFIKQRQEEMHSHLDEELGLVEAEIIRIIESHQDLKVNYMLLQSIRGIGKVLAVYFILLTHNFTRFQDPRKFACYAGIAPFEYSSGSSVRGRTKVHACANRQIKALLNMAAMTCIQIKGEYKTYYQRRVAEGKNKMSTLNIIRNKLVYRVFAVVKRGTPYVDLSKFAA
jgi:transposase